MIPQAQASDPFESADKAQPRTGGRHYFGSVLVDAWYAVLVKGEGKVVFDPAKHNADQRVTALEITLTPLPRDGVVEYQQIRRELIAESAEWAKTIKPSLEKLGLTLKAVNNKWAHVEMVDTGRRYRNKAGEEKVATTFKFLAVYDSEADCRAACDAFYSTRSGTAQPPQQPQDVQTAAPTAPNGAERQMAAKFLPALFKTAAEAAKTAGKPDEVMTFFATEIAKNGLTRKYFTLDSQEVIDVAMANTSSF